MARGWEPTKPTELKCQKRTGSQFFVNSAHQYFFSYKKKVNKQKIIIDPLFEKLKKQTTDLELQDRKLMGLSLITNKIPRPIVEKVYGNLCMTGAIKRKAMAKIKFMNSKQGLLTSLMIYTENMKLDFDGIIRLIYDETHDLSTNH
jgi:hypothetical protein